MSVGVVGGDQWGSSSAVATGVRPPVARGGGGIGRGVNPTARGGMGIMGKAPMASRGRATGRPHPYAPTQMKGRFQ